MPVRKSCRRTSCHADGFFPGGPCDADKSFPGGGRFCLSNVDGSFPVGRSCLSNADGSFPGGFFPGVGRKPRRPAVRRGEEGPFPKTGRAASLESHARAVLPGPAGRTGCFCYFMRPAAPSSAARMTMKKRPRLERNVRHEKGSARSMKGSAKGCALRRR